MTRSDIENILGPHGAMARRMPHYEVRPPQIEMAVRVMNAIQDRRSVAIEAPTGIGKSFAYLIPAILSGKQVIVSTGYKTLQDQLVEKDVPVLRDLLERDFTVEVAKGRNNYLCHYKWFRYQEEFAGIPEAEGKPLPVMDEIALKLKDDAFQGDVEFLDHALPPRLRSEVVSFPDDCLQSRCRYAAEECYVNSMRDRAFAANLVITNHYLLLHALLMSREMGEPMFLPYPDVYVIDEAHHLEQVATHVFSVEVTSQALGNLFGRDMFQRAFNAVLGRAQTRQLQDRHRSIVAAVSAEVDENGVILGDLDMMAGWAAELAEVVDTMESGRAAAVKEVIDQDEFDAEFELALGALQNEVDNMQAVAHEDRAYIRYVEEGERRSRNIVLKRAPLLPEEELRALLFEADERPVICTSATLTANGAFDHFQRQCGLAPADLPAYRMDYIFDYASNALLYQPAIQAYDWENPEVYYEAVAQEIRLLLDVTRGRTLCLFTSWKALDWVAPLLQTGDQKVIWPLRSQRDGTKRELVQWFLDTPYSVLCATRSFWEGVDIPGDKLVSVVLDKLPFPNPRDPVHHHRQKLLQAMHGEGDQWWGFREYAVPHMALALKQGFGRLLRRASDRGVVTVLDTRLTTKGYGKATRQDDLPPARFIRRIGDVHAFFAQTFHLGADYGLNLFPPDQPGDKAAVELTVLRNAKSARLELDVPFVSDPRQSEAVCLEAGLAQLRQRIENQGRRVADFRLEIRCRYSRDQLLTLAEPTLAPQVDAWAAVHWIELTGPAHPPADAAAGRS